MVPNGFLFLYISQNYYLLLNFTHYRHLFLYLNIKYIFSTTWISLSPDTFGSAYLLRPIS